jgi:hypothetical protein
VRIVAYSITIGARPENEIKVLSFIHSLLFQMFKMFLFLLYEDNIPYIFLQLIKRSCKLRLTRLALGRQSSMEKTSLAFPSGSLGRKTPTASTSIWYRQDENTGSGSSRRYSFSRPEKRCQKAHETDFLGNAQEDPICLASVFGELIIMKC